jgi:hypothetical protein
MLLWDLVDDTGEVKRTGQFPGVASAKVETREVRVRANSTTVRSSAAGGGGSTTSVSRADRTNLAQAVELVIVHSDQTTHDFGNGPLLHVPVTINLMNCSGRWFASFAADCPHFLLCLDA